jgi:hypothetical protein
MSNDFKTEYLLEADEYEDQPREPRRPTPDENADEQFSVDSYDADEMTQEPETNQDEIVSDEYEPGSDEFEFEPEDDDGISQSEVSEIITDITQFLPNTDGDVIREWVEYVLKTENVDNASDFLETFEDATAMTDSFEKFRSGDLGYVPSPEDEDSEKNDSEESEKAESEEPDEEKDEPIEESNKLKSKKRLSENELMWYSVSFDTFVPSSSHGSVVSFFKQHSPCFLVSVSEDVDVADVVYNWGDSTIFDIGDPISADYNYAKNYVRKRGGILVDTITDITSEEDLENELSVIYKKLTELQNNYNQLMRNEPIEESKKPSMSEFIEYLDDSAPSGEDEWIIGGKLRSDYMTKGAYGKALQKYDPIAFRVEYNDWIRDRKVDESKKPTPRKRVTESYDKKISEDLQLITTLRNAASASNDAELAKKYADVIEHLKTKLREPAQTIDSHKPAPKIQESIRQRIKARLKR